MDLKSAETFAQLYKALDQAVDSYQPSQKPEQLSAEERFKRLVKYYDTLEREQDPTNSWQNLNDHISVLGHSPSGKRIDIVIERNMKEYDPNLDYFADTYTEFVTRITCDQRQLPLECVTNYVGVLAYNEAEASRRLGSIEETFEAAAQLLGVELQTSNV